MHPDKNPNDPKAADNFLHLNNAYKILMDQEKRALYDETGEYEDNERAPIDLDVTYNYYRLIYPRIKVEDIDNFSEKYRNSKEEENDLIEFYNTNKGNISDILECIPLSTNNDVDRFINIYDRLINQGILKKYKKYEKSKNNIKRKEKFYFFPFFLRLFLNFFSSISGILFKSTPNLEANICKSLFLFCCLRIICFCKSSN